MITRPTLFRVRPPKVVGRVDQPSPAHPPNRTLYARGPNGSCATRRCAAPVPGAGGAGRLQGVGFFARVFCARNAVWGAPRGAAVGVLARCRVGAPWRARARGAHSWPRPGTQLPALGIKPETIGFRNITIDSDKVWVRGGDMFPCGARARARARRRCRRRHARVLIRVWVCGGGGEISRGRARARTRARRVCRV